MQRQFPKFINRNKPSTRFDDNPQWKPAAILVISLLFVMVIVFELNTAATMHRSHHEDIKVLQLDNHQDTVREIQGHWNISKWKYYETLDPVISTYDIAAEDIMSRRLDDQNESKGFWVLGFSENESVVGENNFIRLSNFQYAEPLEVALGLTLYLEGSVALEIKFWSNIGMKDTISISTEGRYFNHGICNEIITVPFGGYVSQVEITAIIADDQAFAAIDKVALAIGSLNKSSSLMYTMLPSDWCQTIGDRSNTIGKRLRYKY